MVAALWGLYTGQFKMEQTLLMLSYTNRGTAKATARAGNLTHPLSTSTLSLMLSITHTFPMLTLHVDFYIPRPGNNSANSSAF